MFIFTGNNSTYYFKEIILHKKLFIDSQKAIFVSSFFFVLFTNYTFFSKVFYFAHLEENLLITITVPFVFFWMLVLILNILLVVTYKYSLKGVLILLVIISAVSSYFMNTFGTIIDKDMITNVLQTDAMEVFDLITFKFLLYLFGLGLIPTYLIYKQKIEYKRYPIEVGNKLLFIVMSLVIISLSYLFLSKNYSSFFRNHGEVRYYTTPTYPVYSLVKFITVHFATQKTITPIGLDASKPLNNKKRLVVFVVGETARAENFSLNGYQTDTNPNLEKQANIVSFSNFYSCGTATAISVPCMFSKFGREEYSDEKQYYENVVDILNRVGVRVLWRDNNSGGSKGLADRVSDVQYFGGDVFDEVMLKELQKNIDSLYRDTFVVLHQEGSHGPTYFRRYPDNFKKFTPTCDTQDLEKCTQQQIVNTYNNTIAYTDFFLNETVKFLEKNEEKYETLMVYVSDHGESLGENGIYLHGLPYMLAPDTQKHVPAIFWFGKDFQKEKKELVTKKDAPFSHDNLFHTILGVFQIDTKEYDGRLDILNLNKEKII